MFGRKMEVIRIISACMVAATLFAVTPTASAVESKATDAVTGLYTAFGPGIAQL